MSIFKKGKLSKPEFISKMIGAVISLLAFGFMWTVQFPGDTLKDNGTLSFSAMHTTFSIAFLVGLFVYIVILMRKSLDENLEWDFDETVSGENPFGNVAGLFILLLLIIGASRFYKDSKEIYNQTVIYQNNYEQLSQEKETYYDNMWKSYTLKHNVLIENKVTFIEVTKMIMDGRHDGEKLTWKWLQENQPVPYEEFTSFYSDLSQFVETQRAGYLALEIKSQNIAKANNILLQTVPNNLYNKILNRSQIDYKPGFTSTKTRKIFSTRLEEL
jgi:hypothetical protein